MAKRICPVCEAACGLSLSTDGRRVIAIEPNGDDVFSRGHACAKGLALRQLDDDPDRLRTPRIREGNGLRDASFEEAFALIQRRLREIRELHGANAIASYVGNPTAHNIGLSMGLGTFLASLGSKNLYTAASVDQLPKHLASELMFGNDMAVPVPDIERTDYLLMLGANPVVSNGSLWVVPGFREHLRSLQVRGGRLVTVDPRRTETGRLADEHHFIRPGTDAWLLGALVNELVRLGASPHAGRGWPRLLAALAPMTLTEASDRTGMSVPAIKAIAKSLLDAERSAVYGRVGTTLQAFGTLTSFLVEVINLLTGNLDRAGGAMFPEQPYSGAPAESRGGSYHRYRSRVSGYPEINGQLPVAALAEEIETPGEGQVRALVTFAGNPVISNPDSDRLARALGKLDFMVSVDIYENETTRFADVILPGTSPFEEGHYDHFLGAMGYRNAARYSPPVFDTAEQREWNLGLSLAYIMNTADRWTPAALQAFEDDVVAGAVAAHTTHEDSRLHGRDVQEIVGMLPSQGVERMLDLGIRAGRFGDAFGQDAGGLTLQKMIEAEDGIDLGSLRAGRLEEVVRFEDGEIDLAPSLVLEDIGRLLAEPVPAGFTLVGRRSAGTNNSWLHNLPMLTKGRPVCVLEMHAGDALDLDVSEGDTVRLETSVGALDVTVRLTEDMARGVVSLPHGFSKAGDVLPGQAKGPNYNSIVPVTSMDRPSGTSALNGVPVQISRLA